MKSVYSLHCTVCRNNYDGRSSWLKHLFQLEHQNKAREKCVKTWFSGGKCKDKVEGSLVVIFSSFSLNQLNMLESLLERLCEIGDGSSGFSLIADFVWWPERDRVGYIQFESRKLVNELFEVLDDGPNLKVESKLVQLKRAVDIPKLEFNALLPREIANEIFLERNIINPLAPTTTTSTTPILPSPLIPASSYIPNAKTSLQLQFNSICKSTEIPDSEFSEILKITQTLKDLFTEKDPRSQLIMFRNFYLRLRNNGSNTLIIYGYIPDDNESNLNRFLKVDSSIAEIIFESSKFKEGLPGFVRLPMKSCSDGGKAFLNETTKLQFTLILYPLHIVEPHLSLLIQYLCSFDTHVRPLLLLVHFWARSNCVQLAEQNVGFSLSHSICPEPSALEWMVILFLAREGLVPRVREILERPHLFRSIGAHQIDFGFWMDPEYPKEWKRERGIKENVTSDQFVLEVVGLAGKFFEFYGANLERGCWVLNPKDGEIIKREGGRIGKSGLSEEEIKSLTFVQNSTERARKNKMRISHARIFVLNPLHVTWRLSFCVRTWTNSTCGKMKETGKQLGEYLSGMRNGKGSGLSLASALKVN